MLRHAPIRNAMPTLTHERRAGGIVAGVDEVGRGPLAGPVVAAAAVFHAPPPRALAVRIDDSKKLSAAQRDAVYDALRGLAQAGSLQWSVAAACVGTIDRINILQATFLAMQRAVARLPVAPTLVLVDGNQHPHFGCPARAIVGGDGESLSIAAASILAKVTRDRLMERLDRRYPGFGWAGNKGYGTAQHLQAIAHAGPTPHHRLSFAPLAQRQLSL